MTPKGFYTPHESFVSQLWKTSFQLAWSDMPSQLNIELCDMICRQHISDDDNSYRDVEFDCTKARFVCPPLQSNFKLSLEGLEYK